MNAETGRRQAGEQTRVIHIPTGSVSLEGSLSVPDNPCGLVLVAHTSGHRRCRLRHAALAEQLRSFGLGTLLVDLLTSQEGAEDTKCGHLRFNIGLLTQRLACAAHWVAGEDEARHLQIGFLGSSTSAAAALVAAADLGRSIGAVVSCSGRPDLAGNALRRVKCPTLLIVGGQDETVLELNQEAGDMLDGEKELRIVPRAGHHFEERGTLDELGRMAAAWFSQHLQRSAGSRFSR